MRWSELRADRVLREITEVCRDPRSPLELLSTAATTFDEAVPTDASCWSTFDPATTMVTSAVGRDLDERGPAATRFFELEYTLDTPSRYRALATTGRHSALIIAENLTDGDHHGQAAVREHLADMGVAQELRVLFQHQGAGWGGVGLMRTAGSAPFGDEEIDFAQRVAPILAAGVRAALVRAAVPDLAVSAHDGPAVLVVDGDQITESTPAAGAWLDSLVRTDAGHGSLPVAVRAVAAHAASGRTVAQRARSSEGTWLVLRSAPLSDGRAVVTIEVAGPPDVASIVSAALGLTDRELDVVAGVLRGRSTKEIARDLHLSAYTVQDHLKSVFAKARVNSRRELVAEVFFGVYAPRLGDPVGVDGFFR